MQENEIFFNILVNLNWVLKILNFFHYVNAKKLFFCIYKHLWRLNFFEDFVLRGFSVL